MTVFHEGETALQREAGSYERLAAVGDRVIRDWLPEQHQEFYPLLPFLLAGSLDAAGQPWASVLAGPAGFAHAPDARRLRVDALPAQHDPLHANLRAGAPLGLLGIQPHTRRRNRLNGRVAEVDARGFSVDVGQSFGNCPKYIQAREPLYEPARLRAAPRVRELGSLDGAARELVAQADTFFIASAHPEAGHAAATAHGVDVSHRGGPAGFVRVDDGGMRLAVPDYPGNSYFNTLGNLHVNPRCGLLFIDFRGTAVLQIAARSEILDRGGRVLRLHITGARWIDDALPLRWL